MLKDPNHLDPIFASYPEIEIVYLFGSTAVGQTHADSDTDIGIVCRGGDLPPSREASLAARLAPIFGTARIDIVTLNRPGVSPLLRFEAVDNGKLLYRSVPDDRINEFEMGVYREYFDTEPMRRLEREYLEADYLPRPGHGV